MLRFAIRWIQRATDLHRSTLGRRRHSGGRRERGGGTWTPLGRHTRKAPLWMMKDLNPSLDENTGPTLAPPGRLGVHQTRPTTRRIFGSCLLSSFPSKSPIASNPPVSVPYSRCSCFVRALTEPKLFRNPRCWLHTEGQRNPQVHSHLTCSRIKSRLQLCN